MDYSAPHVEALVRWFSEQVRNAVVYNACHVEALVRRFSEQVRSAMAGESDWRTST